MKTLKTNIKMLRVIRTLIFTLVLTFSFSDLARSQSDPDLELAYEYLNQGRNSEAAELFENYVTKNPGEVKIVLQLAYIHKNLGNQAVAKKYFEYVVNNSTSSDDVFAARQELDMMNGSSTTSTGGTLTQAYDLLNKGQNDAAITLFEEHIKSNPNDTKTLLQLGYLYKGKADYNKALDYFTKVYNLSLKSEELKSASSEISDINNILNPNKNVTTNQGNVTSQSNNENLNKAYSLLNHGFKDAAIPYFEQYLITNPSDTKIQMQLAYLYYEMQQYSRAKERFKYVADNSIFSVEKTQALNSIRTIDDMNRTSRIPQIVDIYFYNTYDSYQQNYISNFLGKYGFEIARSLTAGFYGDVYLDSKSNKENILNDRYVEGGAFLKYNINNNMALEVRAGYVSQFDREKQGFNFKPVFSFGNTFNAPPTFLAPNASKKEWLYLQFYGAALYDYKYRNLFGQGFLKEGLRFMLGGYSYFEFYLRQNGNFDSQNLEFNNYLEFAGGIQFAPNIKHFPSLFVEATNKVFLRNENGSESKNTFQVRAGFVVGYFSIF